MLLFFASFSLSAVFGIDYGSEYIKVGMALPGKSVHVALNQQSKRLSPSYFAFWNISSPRNTHTEEHWKKMDLRNCSWSFLDSAKSHYLRFPQNALRGLSPLLTNEHGFTRREYLALVLRHLITTVDDGQWKPETASIVFAVEPTIPHEERVAIYEAVKLIKAQLISIVDSPTCAATLYALEKRSLFVNKSKTVVFMDIGASHSWAGVYKFVWHKKQPHVEELAISFNYSLGGNLMDQKIAELLMIKFEEKFKTSVKSVRDKLQFLEESRRAKEILSLHDQVDIKIDDVNGEYDFEYKLTKPEFEKEIQQFNFSLQELFADVVSKANISQSDVDSIELLGGSTRVPFVKESLKYMSGMEKLNRTMNSEEAIALGAGYIGASLSGQFVVKLCKIRPFSLINVSMTDGNTTTPLFDEFSRIHEVKILLFTVEDMPEKFTIISGNNSTKIMTYHVEIPKDAIKTDEIHLKFGFDHRKVPVLFNATLNGDPDVKLKIEKTRPDWMMDDDEYIESTNFIFKMDMILKERHKLQEFKNNYESYIYKIKNRLEYDKIFIQVLSKKDKKTFEDTIKSHLAWFENPPMANPTSKDFSKKLGELKKVTHDAEIRAEQLPKRSESFKALNRTLGVVLNSINGTWKAFRKWIPKEKMDALWTLYNSTEKWYKDKLRLQSQAKDFENPVVMVSEIDRRRFQLEKTYNKTAAIKEPTPTPKIKPKKQPKQIKSNTTNTNQTKTNETDHGESETPKSENIESKDAETKSEQTVNEEEDVKEL